MGLFVHLLTLAQNWKIGQAAGHKGAGALSWPLKKFDFS